MDANQTRFQLLLGRADWADCSAEVDRALVPLTDLGGGLAPAGVESPLTPLAGDSEPDVGSAADASLRAPLGPPVALAWDPKRDALVLASRVFLFSTKQTVKVPDMGRRRGADRDAYGNWYWIDADERMLLVASAGSGTTARF